MIHLEVVEVSKAFGGTQALDGVSLAIAAGSVHALVGENGAGKSTLAKIITGIFPMDQGRLAMPWSTASRSSRRSWPWCRA
jgi:ABC-type sugar transport system ATPase subunit